LLAGGRLRAADPPSFFLALRRAAFKSLPAALGDVAGTPAFVDFC